MEGYYMNDKYQDLLAQYDLEVHSSFRSKGTFQFETSQGLAILSEYRSSLQRLALEHEWKTALYEAGFTETDRYFVSKEDSLVVYDRYHTPFVLRHYFRGRECDCSSRKDIHDATKNLARLHLVSDQIPVPSGMHTQAEPIESLFFRKNRELRQIRRFVSRVPMKRSFELLYMAHFDSFYEEACLALESLNQKKGSDAAPKNGICHGSYHHHNILFLPDGRTATVGFTSLCYGPRLMDLYLFMRKVMEKNRYDYSFYESGIKGYAELVPLTGEDHRFLYYLFLYPEKFWKISNRYYNHRKSWVSPKMEEKLNRLLDQSADRQHFLKKLARAL